MKALKEDVNKLLAAAQVHYKRHLNKNVKAMPTLEAGQYVYIRQPPQSILAPEAENIVTVSYNTVISRVSGPYEISTVRDSTLTILEDDVENTISTDRALKASALQEEPSTNCDTRRTAALFRT